MQPSHVIVDGIETPVHLRTCDPRLWFTWALANFPCFNFAARPRGARSRVPQPLEYLDLRDWTFKFDAWAAEYITSTERGIAALLLGFWNSDTEWKCAPRHEDGDRKNFLACFSSMDSTNRAGVVALLQNARFF